MKSVKSIVWGLAFIILGVILALNAIGVTSINVLFKGWWTLFIIIPCLLGLFEGDGKTGNLIGLIVGILLLLSCQEVLDFDLVWSLILPIILIIFGLSFIFKNAAKNIIGKKIKEINDKKYDTKEHLAVFSGQKIDYSKENFEGCDLTAIFGGLKVDLADAKIKKDVVINAKTAFGGIDIYVPKNVNIKINSNSIFGGVENKYKKTEENKITIYINANCLFGGVEIK